MLTDNINVSFLQTTVNYDFLRSIFKVYSCFKENGHNVIGEFGPKIFPFSIWKGGLKILSSVPGSLEMTVEL